MKQFNAEDALEVFRQEEDANYILDDNNAIFLSSRNFTSSSTVLFIRKDFICPECKGKGFTRGKACPPFHLVKMMCTNCQDENGKPTGLTLPKENKHD